MIPVDELRAWVGAADTAPTNALLVSLEAYAVAQVELTTGAYLGPADDFVDRIIGTGSIELRLPHFPVTAVASVEQSWLRDATPTPVAVTDFVLRTPLLVRTAWGVWERGAEFAVTYAAGYEPDAYPPIYRQAVLDIVKATYDAQTAALASAGNVKTESLGEYSYESAISSTDFDAAASSVKAILAQLPRRVRV